MNALLKPEWGEAGVSNDWCITSEWWKSSFWGLEISKYFGEDAIKPCLLKTWIRARTSTPIFFMWGTYIHTYIFYLVSYTSYIDIVPNKFTIWQFSNVNWWLARVFFSVDWILFLLYSYNSGTLQGRRDSSRVDWPIHITGEPMGLL